MHHEISRRRSEGFRDPTIALRIKLTYHARPGGLLTPSLILLQLNSDPRETSLLNLTNHQEI
jgi:hypothetical protein